MESTGLSIALLFLLTFSQIPAIFSQKSIKFKRNSHFDHYVCKTRDVVFDKVGQISVLECNAFCKMSKTCSGTFHVPDSMRCVGCKRKMSCSNKGVDGIMDGSLYYEESGIGECAREPCLNGGTCVDATEGYTCSCNSGYSGPNCEDGGVIEYYSARTMNSFQRGQAFLENNNVNPFNHFVFSVKTSRDAFILLQSDRYDYSTNTESNCDIIIGGWNGNKSQIRRDNHKIMRMTPNILSPDEYRWFWISWNETTISVGKSDQIGTNDIFSLSETQFDLRAIAIGSGQTSSVYWRIPKGMNECDVYPCLNGSTCKDGVNNRTCICPEGYEGQNCDDPVYLSPETLNDAKDLTN